MAERAEIVLSARDATASAFQQVQSRLATLRAGLAGFAGGAAFGALGAAAAALGTAFDKIDPRSVIDAADQLNKLSQRAGIAVETLSGYQYAAKLADVSNEELSGSLKKLNVNIAAAARGEKEQAAAFQAIGVAVKDASGNVRSANAVFEDLAARFSQYEDGANKVAIANAVGGRSFEKLIPLLNGGREGLREARAELEKFGGVIGGDLARKSEEFNDNMARLGVATDALKVSLASGLIERLVDLSREMVEAAKNGGLLEYSMSRLVDVFSGKASREFFFGKALPPDKLKAAREEVAEVTVQVARLQDYLARNPNSAGTQRAIDALTQRVAGAKALLDAEEKRGAAIGGGRGVVNPALVVPRKTDAPARPRSGGAGPTRDDGTALLKKQLDGRIKAIQDGLERERDLFHFAQTKLAEEFSASRLSIDAFYAAKAQAQQDFLAVQAKGFADEIAAQREFQAKFKKPVDKEEAGNKIVDALARQSRAYREAGQATELAELQRARASDDFRKSLVELDAQLADLSGDRFGAELKRNAVRLQEAQEFLAKGGGDPERENGLRRLLQLQAEFGKAQEDNARIVEKAQLAEEAFLLQADRSGLSRLEAERGVLGIRNESIRQLDELIARTEVLARASTDPDLIAFYERLKLARERAFDAKDPGLLRYQEIAKNSGELLAGGLEDAVVEGKKLGDVFKQMEKDFVRLVARDFITTPLATSLSNFFKQQMGAGGTQAGGLGGGDLFSWVGTIARLFGGGGGGGFGTGAAFGNVDYGAFLHGGGLAGIGGTYRPVPAGLFNEATPRYHRGGLAHDEVPAVLRRREEVLRTDDPRHRDNVGRGGGARAVQVTNHFVLQQPASRETQSQIARRAGMAIQQSMARDG